MIRVTPSIETINDSLKYEFFAGRDDAGKAVWTNDFAKIQPMAEWQDNMGCVTTTYNAPLKKYLMCVTDGGTTMKHYNTYILESDQITGPWMLATYMKHFGEEAYFVNIPSKFISADGRKFWLCYSANFAHGWGATSCRFLPPGNSDRMCLQEVNLLSPSDPIPALPPNPLNVEDNVAKKAVISASSTHPGYSVQAMVDGYTGGYPGTPEQEWASHGEKDTAVVRLTWDKPQTIDRVLLFDRPIAEEQITSEMLVFSDGTTIPVGALPDDAKKGLEVKFEPKTVKWMVLIVTGVSPKTLHIGLSEIAVFRAARSKSEKNVISLSAWVFRKL